MPKRNAISIENSTILRRSPRLLHQKNSTKSTKIQKPKSRKNRIFSSPISSAKITQLDSTLSSIKNTSLKKTHEGYTEKRTKKSTRSTGEFKKSAKSVNGSTKSAKSVVGDAGFSALRRSPRLSNRKSNPEHVDKKTGDNDKSASSENLGKRRTGSRQVMNSSMEVAEKRECRRSNSTSVISTAMTLIEGLEDKREINGGDEVIEVKRKGNQEDKNWDLKGWTKYQEVALQRAYFVAKPSPHFWKKVSKLVPGKSAQECFDKIHSDLVTPPQPQPRSRVNRTNSSPLGRFSLSGSKLLEPSDVNIKRPRSSKRKSHLAQKTVRHLLQKHSVVDQGYEADLFSVLETNMSSSTQAFPQTKILSTPKRVPKKSDFLQNCNERSSSALKKSLSRFGRSLCETSLASPPVLKKVKNIGLHEKYIDQLHCREARRRAAFSRAAKCINSREDRKDSHVLKIDVVKIARNSLVSDARDVINRYQHQQANIMNNYDDFEDDGDEDDQVEVDTLS